MAMVYCASSHCFRPLVLPTEQLSYVNNSITRSQFSSLTNKSALVSLTSQLKLGHTFSTSCYCKRSPEQFEDFSVLESDIPWDSGSIWSSYAFYLFSFHVPLSFGGLSAVAQVLNQRLLDSQTQALSFFVIQMFELGLVYWVVSHVARPQYDPLSFFKVKNQSKARNWVLASALGFGFLILGVFFTSLFADQLPGTEPVETTNQMVKDIISSGAISQTCCILAYCIITPLLEEIIYRGIIFTSLASQMKWYQAIVISSAVFSAAHFSVDNFLQLFVVGSVLGCSYCWTGNLSSSFVIHSLYNALILINTYLS